MVTSEERINLLKASMNRWRTSFVFSAALAVIGTLLGLVPFILIYLIATHLFGQPATQVDQGYIWMLAGSSVLAIVLKAVCNALSSRISHVATYNILHDMRLELARKLSTLPLGYFSQHTTGEIKKILQEDVEQVEEALAHAIPDITSATAVPLITAVILFIVDWRMALATLALFPLFIVIVGWSSKSSQPFVQVYQDAQARVNAVIIQYVQGMKVIKTFTRTGESYAEYKKAIEEYTDVTERFMRQGLLRSTIFNVLLRANILVLLPVGVGLYLTGRLDVPTFVLFLLLGYSFNIPLFKLSVLASIFVSRIRASLERIDEVMNETSLPEPANPVIPQHHRLTFKNVHFGYSDQQEVLHDVSFHIPDGSFTALVGPSGAGKTTIARLIPRFWDVTDGEILIGDVNVKQIPLEALMDMISFVFQDVFLFNDTIYENIRVGKPTASAAEILHAARLARVDEFAQTFPEGYQMVVGENGSRLSGGQRQRISIARAILKDAPIVVLDEATAFVDPENENLIQEAIATLVHSDPASPKTLVVVAHRLSTIVPADQILVVEKGRVVAQGSHTDLLVRSDLYQSLWQSHMRAQAWRIETQARPIPKSSLPPREVPTTVKPLEDVYGDLQGSSFLTMVLRLAGPFKKEFIQSVILRIIQGAVIGAPVVITYLVLVKLFAGTLAWSDMRLFLLALVISFLIDGVFHYWSDHIIWFVNVRSIGHLRLHLGEHLRRLPLGFFFSHDTGQINSLLTNDLSKIDLNTLPEKFLQAVVSPLVTLIVLLVLDWRMALAAAAGVPFFILVVLWSDRLYNRVWRELTETRTVANSRLIEYIQGIRVIRAFNLVGDRFARFARAMADYRQASVDTSVMLTPSTVAAPVVLEMGFAIVIVVGTALFLAGSVTASLFLLFMLLATIFYNPIVEGVELTSYWRRVQHSTRRVNQLLNTRPLPEPAVDRHPGYTDIVFDNVTFSYEEEPVLQEVRFTIPQGSITALVGPSGAGKTTITSLIARFWDVAAGAVKIGGVDVREMTTDTLFSQLTMVFQDVYLFNDTIFNNIKFGNPAATTEQVLDAARMAQCHDFIVALPDGYETVVGEGGATLSGGEKQRISIARAILKDAPIILLDEATVAIDPENEQLVQQALKALIAAEKGTTKTLVIIAHRLATIQTADNILVVENGRIVQEGTHAALLAQAGRYRHFWEEQQKARCWQLGTAVTTDSAPAASH